MWWQHLQLPQRFTSTQPLASLVYQTHRSGETLAEKLAVSDDCSHRLVSVAASTKTSAVHTQAYIHTAYQTTSSKTSVTPPHIQQRISALKTNYLAAENTSSFTINRHQHFV